MTTGKNHSFDYKDFCRLSNVSAFFNTLSRFAIAFLLRRKCFLISWLQSPSTVIFGAQEYKSAVAHVKLHFGDTPKPSSVTNVDDLLFSEILTVASIHTSLLS